MAQLVAGRIHECHRGVMHGEFFGATPGQTNGPLNLLSTFNQTYFKHMEIGISEQNRKAVSDKLQILLADEYLLYTKTRNYHWNIRSYNFNELHSFYEEQYDELADVIDDVAERIRTLGQISNGRMSDFLELTRLEEQDYTTKAKEQLQNLINDHESIIRYLRQCITEFDEKHDDMGSSDFVTALMARHEKMRWMLESFLP